MNEKKFFAYRILTLIFAGIFSIVVRSAWLQFFVAAGLVVTLFFDVKHYIKFRSLPKYGYLELIKVSNIAARDAFFGMLLLLMFLMVYLDTWSIQFNPLMVTGPLFAFAIIYYWISFIYHKWSIYPAEKEKDYYVSRIFSLISVVLGFSFISQTFANFNLSIFFLALIPGIITLAITFFSWKKEFYGGFLFAITGILWILINMFLNLKLGNLFGTLLIVTGFLFMISKIRA